MGHTYSAFRINGGPTQYAPAYHTAVVDVLTTGFILAFCMLGFAFFLIVPGFPGIKRLNFIIRVVVSLFIGAAILRNPVEQLVEETDLVENNTHWSEHIDYNERFTWAWQQGRFGFGPYAGRINREFRDAQYRGLPLPILWVAEYFTLDGELIRWGRSFRQAGWYTWQVLWTAFPLWLISNALSVMVLSYCGIGFIMTGLFMEISVIVYATIRFGTQPLEIPFEDGVMHFHYGSSFWLTMAGGIVSIVYGVLILATDFWYPHTAADFFGIDVLQDPEEFYHKEKEPEVVAEPTGQSFRPTKGGVARRLKTRRDDYRPGVSSRFKKSNRRKTNPDRAAHTNEAVYVDADALDEESGPSNTVL